MADFKKIAKISVHALLGVASFATIVFLPQLSGIFNKLFESIGKTIDKNDSLTGFIENLCSEIFSESFDEIVVDNIKDICEEIINDSEMSNYTIESIDDLTGLTGEDFKKKYLNIIVETVEGHKKADKIKKTDVKKISEAFIDYQKQLNVEKDVLEKSATYKALSDDEKVLFTKIYKKCRASWLHKMFLNRVDKEAQIVTNVIIDTLLEAQDENRKYIETLFAQYLGGNGGKFNLSQIQTTKFEYGFYLQQCPHCGYDGEYIYPTNADKSEYFCCACGKKYEVIRGIKDKDEIIKAIEKVGDGLKSHLNDKFSDQANQIKSVDEKINQLATEKVIKELMNNNKVDTDKAFNDLKKQLDDNAINLGKQIELLVNREEKTNLILQKNQESINEQLMDIKTYLYSNLDTKSLSQGTLDEIEKLLRDSRDVYSKQIAMLISKIENENAGDMGWVSNLINDLQSLSAIVQMEREVLPHLRYERCPYCDSKLRENVNRTKYVRCEKCREEFWDIDILKNNYESCKDYFASQGSYDEEKQRLKKGIEIFTDKSVVVANYIRNENRYEINYDGYRSLIVIKCFKNDRGEEQRLRVAKFIDFNTRDLPDTIILPYCTYNSIEQCGFRRFEIKK